MTPPAVGAAGAWLLLAPDAVPESLRARAVPMAVVMLRPGESVLGAVGQARSATLLDEDELRVARLAARGASRVEMAVRLGVSRRTVDRRLASLRDRFDVRSAAELAAVLTQRGIS